MARLAAAIIPPSDARRPTRLPVVDFSSLRALGSADPPTLWTVEAPVDPDSILAWLLPTRSKSFISRARGPSVVPVGSRGNSWSPPLLRRKDGFRDTLAVWRAAPTSLGKNDPSVSVDHRRNEDGRRRATSLVTTSMGAVNSSPTAIPGGFCACPPGDGWRPISQSALAPPPTILVSSLLSRRGTYGTPMSPSGSRRVWLGRLGRFFPEARCPRSQRETDPALSASASGSSRSLTSSSSPTAAPAASSEATALPAVLLLSSSSPVSRMLSLLWNRPMRDMDGDAGPPVPAPPVPAPPGAWSSPPPLPPMAPSPLPLPLPSG
mmetsp:Transcript_31255/g.91534  ORF Transcript_31255/g.91534 Transcript_31255/m.91534 type:complete len:321 (-) Transcript_31255:444-1406(-)